MATPAAGRFDPYKNFRFKVQWDGRYVAGVSKVSGLIRTTDVVEHREGGDPSTSHKSPGLTQYAPITLARGLTQDTDFESWANEISQLGTGQTNFRKNITIDLFDEDERKIASYKVFRCWPSEYQAIAGLDADADSVAIERLRLENEGWERDAGVVPPA